MQSCQDLEPEAPGVLRSTGGDRHHPGVPGDLDGLGQQDVVGPLERADLRGKLAGARRGREREARQNLHGSRSYQLLLPLLRLQLDSLAESGHLEVQDSRIAVAADERDLSCRHQT